jgi:holo-[acyl-carrier protein] synthase
MILGVGTDLVHVPRVDAILRRYGAEAFGRHALAAPERALIGSEINPASFFAKRFAAKEAFAKAVGTGLRWPVSLTQIWVGREPLGRPTLCFEPELAAWLAANGFGRAHLSLTDEHEFAQAFVVVETAT